MNNEYSPLNTVQFSWSIAESLYFGMNYSKWFRETTHDTHKVDILTFCHFVNRNWHKPIRPFIHIPSRSPFIILDFYRVFECIPCSMFNYKMSNIKVNNLCIVQYWLYGWNKRVYAGNTHTHTHRAILLKFVDTIFLCAKLIISTQCIVPTDEMTSIFIIFFI